MIFADLDTWAFKAVNGLAFAPLEKLFVAVSTPAFGLGLAVALSLYLAWRRRWGGVWVILVGVLAVALSDSIGARVFKPFIGRVRPCFALPPDAVRLLVPISHSGSMPSLHAANYMAVAVVAFLGDRRTGLVLFPIALLVGTSRVGVGVHWPSDVLVGAAWGALAAAVAWGVAGLAASALRRPPGRTVDPRVNAPGPAVPSARREE